MFQFSDDFDADLEDLLDATVNICNERMTGDIVSCRENQCAVPTPHNNSSMLKDDLNSVGFDEFDEDNFVLIAANDVDSVFKEKWADQQCCGTISLNNKLSENSTPQKEKSLNTSSGSDKSCSSRSTDFDSHQKLNVHEAKHKLMVTTDSPFTAKLAKIKYERKFPGPAGLIARKSREDISPSGCEKQTTNVAKQQLGANLTEHSLFENSPWQQLLNDLNTKSHDLSKIISDYTVACVKRMNIIKHKSRKIPLFAAVIHHLDATVLDPSIILKDPSGEIRGTLHKDLWELYNHLLPVGSTLLLKQVSVLSIASSRKLYLNVTKNNLATIYTPQTDGKPVLVTHLLPVSISECVHEAKTDVNPANKYLTADTKKQYYSAAGNNHDSMKINDPGNNKVGLNTQNLVIPSTSDVTLAEVSKKKCASYVDNNNGFISILSEFEGIDEDSLFDDF